MSIPHDLLPPPSPDYGEEMEELDEEDDLLLQLYATNNTILSQFLEEDDEPRRKGSVPGHIVINRGREGAAKKLWNDYFSENPTYGEERFRKRFRMHRKLFLSIVDAVKSHDNFFVQKKDGLGRLGLSTLQKITSAFRMLAYGAPSDSKDENLQIAVTQDIHTQEEAGEEDEVEQAHRSLDPHED